VSEREGGLSSTRDVAHAYLDAWPAGDLDAVRGLVAAGATVECNLTGHGDAAHLVAALGRLAAAVDAVRLVSEVYVGGRAALVSDWLVGGDRVRVAEYLTVVDCWIADLRRVGDAVAARQLLRCM